MRLAIWPDDVLEKPCDPVTEFTAQLRAFREDLEITCAVHNGVGLAAPQVGASIRALVVRQWSPGLTEDKFIFMVNPRLVGESLDVETDEEACLSLPGEVVSVERAKRVEVEFQDETGAVQRLEAEGFFARAVQHELDHLDGVTLATNMPAVKRSILRDRMKKAKRKIARSPDPRWIIAQRH